VENNSTSVNSPRSPIGLAPSRFPVATTVIAAICIVPLVFIAGLLAFGLTNAVSGPIDPRHIGVVQALTIQFLAELALVPYLFVVMMRLWKRSARDLGFRVPSKLQVLIGTLGGVAMLGIVQGLALIVQSLLHSHHEQQAVQLLKAIRAPGALTLFIVYAVLVAPFVEELTFRVFVFNAATRLAPFWIEALVSGLLFGVAHADAIAFIPLTVGGLLLCFVYVRTQNAWVSMISHALFNGTTSVALLISRHGAH